MTMIPLTQPMKFIISSKAMKIKLQELPSQSLNWVHVKMYEKELKIRHSRSPRELSRKNRPQAQMIAFDQFLHTENILKVSWPPSIFY